LVACPHLAVVDGLARYNPNDNQVMARL
jgi:hypothetical protein